MFTNPDVFFSFFPFLSMAINQICSQCGCSPNAHPYACDVYVMNIQIYTLRERGTVLGRRLPIIRESVVFQVMVLLLDLTWIESHLKDEAKTGHWYWWQQFIHAGGWFVTRGNDVMSPLVHASMKWGHRGALPPQLQIFRQAPASSLCHSELSRDTDHIVWTCDVVFLCTSLAIALWMHAERVLLTLEAAFVFVMWTVINKYKDGL